MPQKSPLETALAPVHHRDNAWTRLNVGERKVFANTLRTDKSSWNSYCLWHDRESRGRLLATSLPGPENKRPQLRRGRPGYEILRLLALLTKELHEQREHVDEVEVERECSHDCGMLRRFAVHATVEIFGLESLSVPR